MMRQKCKGSKRNILWADIVEKTNLASLRLSSILPAKESCVLINLLT